MRAVEINVPEVDKTVRSPSDVPNFVTAMPWPSGPRSSSASSRTYSVGSASTSMQSSGTISAPALALLVVVRLLLGSHLRDDDLIGQTRAEIAHSIGRCATPLDRSARLRTPLNRSTARPPAGDSA